MRLIIIFERRKNQVNVFCMEAGTGVSMKIKWQKIRMLILAIVFAMVNSWILNGLTRLKEQADMISLSYPTGAVPESAFEQWKQSEDSEIFLEGVVWKVCGDFKALSKDTGHEQKVTCYQMEGQPAAVFGRELSGGRYFTEGEERVCLLDQDTVRQLFGSENVMGLEIMMDEKDWQIVGVLKGDVPICVIPAEEEQAFDGIVARKKEPGQSTNQAVSVMEAYLGSTDGQQIDGQLYYVLACLMYFVILAVSLVIVGFAAAKKIKRKVKKRGKNQKEARITEISKRCVLPFCLAAAVVILIAGVNAANPGSDYLPTYWSDFEFFSRLFEDKAEQIRSLAIHQEFFVWQRMFVLWRRVIWAEIVAGVLMMVLSMDVLLHLRLHGRGKKRSLVAHLSYRFKRVRRRVQSRLTQQYREE